MSLDQLISTLETRGAAEVAEILGGARAEALDLTRAALDSMRRRREDVVHEHERAWRNEANAAVVEARRAAAAQVLEARAAAVERVWRCAHALLSQADLVPRLRRVAPKYVEEALPYLEGKHVVVRCDATLVDALRAAIRHDGGALTIEVDDKQAAGVTISAADDSVSIDNTLQARLDRLRLKLATEISSRLTARALSNGSEADDARLE